MTTRISSATNLRDISGAAQGANDTRHVRGITVNGARAIYVNKSLGDKIKDIFKRVFGIGPSLTQQREDGARAVREALINQFGVAVADKVLTNVADRTDRTADDLMRQGITTKELHQIEDEVSYDTNDIGLRIIDSSAEAAQRAAAKRRVSDTVNVKVIEWTRGKAPTGDKDIDRAGRAFRNLTVEQQDFVHKRLQAILRQDVEKGARVDDAKIAKATLKLVRQATSGTFDALSKKWAEMNTAAGKLMRSVRGGAATMVDDAMAWGKSKDGVGPLEEKAASKRVATTDEEKLDEFVMSSVGADEKEMLAAQTLDNQAAGMVPVDAQAAYRRAMGTRGPARSLLLAGNIVSQMESVGGVSDSSLEHVKTCVLQGVRQSVLALGAKGHVADVATELKAVQEAWRKAMNEYCRLGSEERQDVERSVKFEVEQKYGRNHRDFNKACDAALKQALQKPQLSEKQRHDLEQSVALEVEQDFGRTHPDFKKAYDAAVKDARQKPENAEESLADIKQSVKLEVQRTKFGRNHPDFNKAYDAALQKAHNARKRLQSIRQSVKLQVEQKFGRTHPDFEKAYDAALKEAVALEVERTKFGRNHRHFKKAHEAMLKRALEKKLEQKKRWFRDTLIKNGLNSDKWEIVAFMDVLLSKAGVADKDQVIGAYNAIRSGAKSGAPKRAGPSKAGPDTYFE